MGEQEREEQQPAEHEVAARLAVEENNGGCQAHTHGMRQGVSREWTTYEIDEGTTEVREGEMGLVM